LKSSDARYAAGSDGGDRVETFYKWERTTRDTLDFKKAYVDIAGNFVAGLCLAVIVYWYLPTKIRARTKLRVKHDEQLWLAKSHKDWRDECRLSE
jgi:hypothetical protein